MTSPKKAEWEEELARWCHDEAVLTKLKVEQLISQTHTDLLAMLKERVEEISKDISDPYPFGNGYTYAPFVPLSDLFTLIDSLLVTDKQ